MSDFRTSKSRVQFSWIWDLTLRPIVTERWHVECLNSCQLMQFASKCALEVFWTHDLPWKKNCNEIVEIPSHKFRKTFKTNVRFTVDSRRIGNCPVCDVLCCLAESAVTRSTRVNVRTNPLEMVGNRFFFYIFFTELFSLFSSLARGPDDEWLHFSVIISLTFFLKNVKMTHN